MWLYWSTILLIVAGVKTQRISSWYDSSNFHRSDNPVSPYHSSYSSYGMQGYGMYNPTTSEPVIPTLSSYYSQPLKKPMTIPTLSTTTISTMFGSRLGLTADNTSSLPSAINTIPITDSSTQPSSLLLPFAVSFQLPTATGSFQLLTSTSPPVPSSTSSTVTTTTGPTIATSAPSSTTANTSGGKLLVPLPASTTLPPSTTTDPTTTDPTPETTSVVETFPPPSNSTIPYPDYKTVPLNLEFSCKNRLDGYYADPETDCQVWHWCVPGGGKYTFLCPEQTVFNQAFLVCDWWYNVNCSEAQDLYSVNEKLYESQ